MRVVAIEFGAAGGAARVTCAGAGAGAGCAVEML
jgi:hypothetical protein